MYWAMLSLTISLLAGIALQLLKWLWGIYPMVAVLVSIVLAIALLSYWSWRMLWKS